jgi:vancomycin resistance protein YoaR
VIGASVAAGFVGSLAAVAAAAAAVESFAPKDGRLPSGTRLAGQPLTGPDAHLATIETIVRRRATELTDRRVAFVVPKTDAKPERTVATASLSELGVSVDVARTLRWLQSVGSPADFIARFEQARLAERGAVDVPLALRFDRARAMALFDTIKEGEDLDPVSARLDVAHHTVLPERPGRYLDGYRAAEEAQALAIALAGGDARTGDLRVELASQSFPARMSTDYVKSLDVTQVIATYETYFSRKGDQARRAKNIEVAAAKLDGLILPPGELVSFNQIVGDRSEENGFEKAWEIFKGEMKEGVGGGTCQVASTFHAAAIFAGIEILERLPHSRPSAYIPIGLDATVVYPVVDMKMRNPHAFPVALHTSVEGNRVRFEILGPRKPAHVSFEREILETLPYTRKVEEDPEVPRNKVVVKQHGIHGFRVKRTREIFLAGGKKRVETSKDYYPPTMEIFKVNPAFDQAKLPPLPDEVDPEPATDPSSAGATIAAAAAIAPAIPSIGAIPAPAIATAAPATSATPPPVAVAAATPPADFTVVDGPGAHAPTAKQATPDKLLKIRR